MAEKRKEKKMALNSRIAWTDHTWNPWQGCHKVSAGCKNCYMFAHQKRFGKDPEHVYRSSPATFNAPLKWKDQARVFVCSLSDFFIEDADQWRKEAWAVMKHSPHLTFLLLTKRPENIARRLPKGWPFKNVWLGVTVEDQAAADSRIPILLFDTVAAKKFVSVEPMLSQIDIRLSLCKTWNDGGITTREYLDWVIVGGESGPNARHMDSKWAFDIKMQCEKSRTPFFMKQMSGKKPIPDELFLREFPE